MTTDQITTNVMILLTFWTIITQFVTLGTLILTLWLTSLIGFPFWTAFIIGFVIFFGLSMLRGPMTRAFVTAGS